jgi:hypothetical protein
MKKLLVVLLVLGMVAPAMAAEWNFYGSARARFFYTDYNKEASSVLNKAGTDTESDTDLDYAVQGNSRIGANVKASDAVTGRFEYGSGPNLRLLYGEFHFGGGSLLVGQDYTPVDTLYSNQVVLDDNGLLYEGMAYEGRKGQLKLKMNGFEVALVPAQVSGLDSGTDVVLPKIELAYDMKMDTMSVGAFGGYQTYSARDAARDDYDVNAWVFGLRGKFNFGPAYVNFCGWYAQNASNYGLVVRNEEAISTINVTDANHTEDATSYAAALAIGSKFNDMVAIEAGIGYIHSEVDDSTPGSNITGEQACTTYYVQVPITLAPGVFIVPEISIFDLGDVKVTGSADTDMGQVAYYGAKFQINF